MIPEGTALIVDENELTEASGGEEAEQNFITRRVRVKVCNLQMGGGV